MGRTHHLNARQKKPLAELLQKADRTTTHSERFEEGPATFWASGVALPFSERVNHPLAEKAPCGKIVQKVLPEKSLRAVHTLTGTALRVSPEMAEITPKPVRA